MNSEFHRRMKFYFSYFSTDINFFIFIFNDWTKTKKVLNPKIAFIFTIEPQFSCVLNLCRTNTHTAFWVRSVIGWSPPYLEFNAQHEVKIISRSTLVELVAAHMWEAHTAEYCYCCCPSLLTCSQLSPSIWFPISVEHLMPDILISNSTVKIVSRSILVELGAAHMWEAYTDY